MTALAFASEKCNEHIVELLLNSGAYVDEKDLSGETPLHRACFYGNVKNAQILLQRGANINSKNILGQTTLHLSCYSKNTNIALFLLKNGANTRAIDFQHCNTLHHATDAGNLRLVEILLKKGVDVSDRALNGCKPLDIAIIKKHNQLIGILRYLPLQYFIEKSLRQWMQLIFARACLNHSSGFKRSVKTLMEYIGLHCGVGFADVRRLIGLHISHRNLGINVHSIITILKMILQEPMINNNRFIDCIAKERHSFTSSSTVLEFLQNGKHFHCQIPKNTEFAYFTYCAKDIMQNFCAYEIATARRDIKSRTRAWISVLQLYGDIPNHEQRYHVNERMFGSLHKSMEYVKRLTLTHGMKENFVVRFSYLRRVVTRKMDQCKWSPWLRQLSEKAKGSFCFALKILTSAKNNKLFQKYLQNLRYGDGVY